MRRSGGYWLLFGLCFLTSAVSAQHAPKPDEVGLSFFFEHFPAPTYGHNPQNWAVVQDRRGLIYVANNDGILEYDGAAWRFIPTTTNSVVRSLATDAQGRVYAGAVGDFGYLEPDSTGVLQYHSLIDKIAVGDRVFQDVWGTHAARDGIYFQTNERLFRWDQIKSANL